MARASKSQQLKPCLCILPNNWRKHWLKLKFVCLLAKDCVKLNKVDDICVLCLCQFERERKRACSLMIKIINVILIIIMAFEFGDLWHRF